MSDSDLTLYVYYKIPSEKSDYFLSAIKKLDQAIKSQYCLIESNHKKRPDVDAEKRELWMETYHGISKSTLEKFTADLISFAEQYGLPKERKYEIFVAL